MPDKETLTSADVATVNAADLITRPTRAERLHGLLLKALPNQSERIKAGAWGPSGAPYVFSTLPGGRQRLVIENPETGDRIGVTGSSRDELLDALEAKLGK